MLRCALHVPTRQCVLHDYLQFNQLSSLTGVEKVTSDFCALSCHLLICSSAM